MKNFKLISIVAIGTLIYRIIAADGLNGRVFLESENKLYPSFTGAIGDLDNDGDLDISTTSGVLLNNGQGVFQALKRHLRFRGYTTLGIAMGDFNGNGHLDLWRTFLDDDIGDAVMFNDGSGILAISDQSFPTESSRAVATGDIDHDGDIDIWVTTYLYRSDRLWLNDGFGNFSLSKEILPGSASMDVKLGDLDNDGDLDAWVVQAVGASLIYLNDGAGSFERINDATKDEMVFGSRSVELGDIDGDGDLDGVLVSNRFLGNGRVIIVWTNDGSASFQISTVIGSHKTFDTALGDLDNDGDLDIWAANDGPDQIWVNDGTGTFSDSKLRMGLFASNDVQLGDLDGDGDLDALVSTPGGALSQIWLNKFLGKKVLIQVTENGIFVHFSGNLMISEEINTPFENIIATTSPYKIKKSLPSAFFKSSF